MDVLHVASKEPVLRVLFIEDDDHDAELVAASFAYGDGHMNALRAGSVKEALDFLYRRPPHEEAARPHFILTDLRLGDGTAFDLLREIKGENALLGLPVVVLAGSRNPSDVEEAYRLGASLYVVKPKDLEGLTEVAHHIDRFFLEVVAVLDEDRQLRAPT